LAFDILENEEGYLSVEEEEKTVTTTPVRAPKAAFTSASILTQKITKTTKKVTVTAPAKTRFDREHEEKKFTGKGGGGGGGGGIGSGSGGGGGGSKKTASKAAPPFMTPGTSSSSRKTSPGDWFFEDDDSWG
jgi:hypothetical protein